MHSQQPQHAFRDPITHGGQIQGLADESADPSQREGLVLLLHELGPTSRVFEEENGLVAEDGQKGQLLIRIAPPRPVCENESAHHVLARAESKLANEGFVAKAPEQVVQAERDKLEQLRRELDELG